MSRRKKIEGYCQICGRYGQLSFEHVPPEKAFNNRKEFYTVTTDELLKIENEGIVDAFQQAIKNKTAKKRQGGIGFNSLCVTCNNNTGSWYATYYIEWIYQLLGILLKANNKPSLYYPTFMFPLRVIKQIITMFFSINKTLRESEPELVEFVLNKNKRFLNPKYKVYCYYNMEGQKRYIGDTIVGDMTSNVITRVSELSFPPLGFVLTIKGEKLDNRLKDITYFSEFEYNHWTEQYQHYNTLPTHLPNIPADYRTKEEINKAILTSLKNRDNY